MLVRDVIKGIENGTLTGKQLSEQYAISTRTISNKIAKLGYDYDNKNNVYNFIGDDLESTENIFFGQLFRVNQRVYDVNGCSYTETN